MKKNAFTPKKAVVAKLSGGGFWVVKNVFAAGCEARKLSNGVGAGDPAGLWPKACSSMLKSAEVATGKPLKLWLTTSRLDPSGIKNLTANPRGLALPLVSGMSGRPVKSEKRTITCTAWVNRTAWDSVDA